jgi:Platelet-activating factor acetylhydrolase, isoform II
MKALDSTPGRRLDGKENKRPRQSWTCATVTPKHEGDVNQSVIVSMFWVLATLWSISSATAYVAGETHRLADQASAAVRDVRHRTELRITVWYPAATGVVAQPLLIGPAQQPFFEAGSVAPNAPFAADPSEKRRAVILLSHGFGGARVMGWFGTAIAEAGYVVVSVDHPGNNAIDEMMVPGAILW